MARAGDPELARQLYSCATGIAVSAGAAVRKLNAYLDRIIDAGFDGIYVDGVDKFEQWKRRRPSALADMVELLGAIASHARELRRSS